MKIAQFPLVVLPFLVAACGGGSSGNAPAAPTSPVLSDTQKNYESAALAANGGLHYLQGALNFVTSATGAASIAPGSYFFTTDSSIPQSAASVAQPVSTSYATAAASLARGPVIGGNRVLVNGAVLTEAFPVQASVSYQGNNILDIHYAQDGKTPVQSVLRTSIQSVGLSGAIAASPNELFTGSDFGIVTNTVNGISLYNRQANWQAGSFYLKAVSQNVGDMLLVGDCVVGATGTTGPDITPCSTTAATLETFFPFSSGASTIVQMSEGQIITLAGVRAWVSNLPLSGATPRYRVFYQSKGNIYAGYLLKDGTPLQITGLGSATPQNFTILFNNAALQSIKSAITF